MEKVFDFLKKNNVTTVATCCADQPRASVLEYYLVGEAIIMATSPNSIKAKNLKANNRISISVHSMPHFVTIDGTVTEPTVQEIESYNQQLLVKHPEFVELMKSGTLQPFVYYKVVIKTAYYNDYSQGMSPVQIFEA